jgi:hypothetical protein
MYSFLRVLDTSAILGLWMKKMKWSSPLGTQTVFAPLVGRLADRAMRSGEVTITCCQNEIPLFVKAEMEELYQNPFSSTAAEHAGNANTSTYIVRNGAVPIAIFLFHQKKRQVKVLNGAIEIGAEEIHRFADYIFTEYKSVQMIIFQSIQTVLVDLPFPYQQFNSSEDIVLTLPSTAQEYLKSLGKSTRKYIKYHLNRPKRHFPSYCYKVYEKDEVDEQLIQSIIDLNTTRMNNKNKVSMIDEEQRNWIIKIARTYGFVGVAKINDQICAGVICSRVGDNYFMHVIAHDPQYDDYRLGTLCCYLTICEAIARGGKEYHFLWGQGEYKYRLLGMQRDLDSVVIFRSRAHYYVNFNEVLKNRFTSCIRQSKIQLENNAKANTPSSRLTATLLECVHTMQRLKHHEQRRHGSSIAEFIRKLRG